MLHKIVNGGSCTKNLPPLIHMPSLADSTRHRGKETPLAPRKIKVMKILYKLSIIILVIQRMYLLQYASCLVVSKGHRWKPAPTGPRGMQHTI